MARRLNAARLQAVVSKVSRCVCSCDCFVSVFVSLSVLVVWGFFIIISIALLICMFLSAVPLAPLVPGLSPEGVDLLAVSRKQKKNNNPKEEEEK